jgi:hypothetical protein
MVPGAGFCHRCGTAADGTVRAPAATAPTAVRVAAGGDRTPWIVAGLLTFVAIAAVVFAARGRGSDAPASMANAGNAASGPSGTPPDLSTMTPREQFQRLADRIQTAMESGDTAQVVQFFPMLEGAFGNLPPGDRDIDARFHMGLLRAQIGHFSEAFAQADSIQQEDSTNLLNYYLRAMTDEYQGKTAEGKAARADFLKHFDAEMQSGRPEYQAHKDLLEAFKKGSGTS